MPSVAPQVGPIASLIARWKADPGSTYNTWFLWEERLKNFRSIRRGIAEVVREIEEGSFGNAYRGSSLETIVGSIAEQRQMFRGADHAFLWKPKLRIPDIYESEVNQRAFGRLLHTCNCCNDPGEVIEAIRAIDRLAIKGLGPAVANLLYFIHPTTVAPFNTAIVNGFNALAGGKVKLGRWDHYLTLRQGVLRLNDAHRKQLSNDLGAVAGLLFDVGSGRYPAPPREDDAGALSAWEADLARVREESAAAAKALALARDGDATHTEIQGALRDLGRDLGFAVWVAANDRGRGFGGGRLGDGCVDELPVAPGHDPESVRLIDVVWLDALSRRVVAAFEVEHSTSIYSGILRMLDLERGTEAGSGSSLFLVAPDNRRDEVAQQLKRPAFAHAQQLGIRYLPYSQLQEHAPAIRRFGAGLKPLLQISQLL